MTSSENQRVVDALRAYTGGLTVTEHDIATAEDRLRERLEPPSQRRRLAVVAAVAAAVLVVGFFAARALDGEEKSAPPAHDTSPGETLEAALQADAYNLSVDEFTAGEQPTRQDMAGFWLLREPFFFPMFVAADGQWVLGPTTDAAGFGRSTLSGDTWTRHHDVNGQCASDAGKEFSQTWQTALAADGSLHMQLTQGSPNCTPADAREVWDRIAAGSPLSDYLAATTDAADWQTAPRSFRLQGVYVSPETGRVLEVGPRGKFFFYDLTSEAGLEPIDRGDAIYDAFDQRVVGTCEGADFSSGAEVAQLPAVEGYVGSLEAVRLGTPDLCTSGLTSEAVWVKVA